MDPGEIELVEQTRQVNTAFGQYQWAQARPASIKGCVPQYPPKSLYPQLDKKMSQMAREPQNLDGMERPFLDANEPCKPGLPPLKNYVYPTMTPYPPTVKPNIEMPFNALDDPHQGWKRYLEQTEGPSRFLTSGQPSSGQPLLSGQRPLNTASPSPAPTPCQSVTFKDFPGCVASSWKDIFYDVTHWSQVPTPKLANIFTGNHRLIYVVITLAAAVLVILLLVSLFKSKPKPSPYVTESEFQAYLRGVAASK